eukprot:4136893-Pyramimonas_sp.AAC.1
MDVVGIVVDVIGMCEDVNVFAADDAMCVHRAYDGERFVLVHARTLDRVQSQATGRCCRTG